MTTTSEMNLDKLHSETQKREIKSPESLGDDMSIPRTHSRINMFKELNDIIIEKTDSWMSWVLFLLPILTLIYNAYDDIQIKLDPIGVCKQPIGLYVNEELDVTIPISNCTNANPIDPPTVGKFKPSSTGIVLIINVCCLLYLIDTYIRLENGNRLSIKLIKYGMILRNKITLKKRVLIHIIMLFILIVLYTILKTQIISSGVYVLPVGIYAIRYGLESKFAIIIISFISVTVYFSLFITFYKKAGNLYLDLTMTDLYQHNLISKIKLVKSLSIDELYVILSEEIGSINKLNKAFWYIPFTKTNKYYFMKLSEIEENDLIPKILSKCSDMDDTIIDEKYTVCGFEII